MGLRTQTENPCFRQGRVQGQPVMAGGFHADDKMIGVSTEGQQDIQKPLKPETSFLKLKAFVDLSGISKTMASRLRLAMSMPR